MHVPPRGLWHVGLSVEDWVGLPERAWQVKTLGFHCSAVGSVLVRERRPTRMARPKRVKKKKPCK